MILFVWVHETYFIWPVLVYQKTICNCGNNIYSIALCFLEFQLEFKYHS